MKKLMNFSICLLSFCSVFAQENYKVHTVQVGNTLYSISKTYDVTVEKIREWNNLGSNSIEIGQRLKIYSLKEEVKTTNGSDVTSTMSNSFLTSGSIPITIPQVKEHFEKIEKEEEVWNFGNIYHLDVIGFYDLADKYDTELKREVLKESQDYNDKLSELKMKKTELISNSYYLELNSGSYANSNMLIKGGAGGRGAAHYDLEAGGIYVNLGAYELAMGGLPQVYRKYFEFKTIPITKARKYNMHGQLEELDNSYYRQLVLFKMDKTTGLEFENHLKDIKIIALFQMDKIDIRKVLMISYYANWYIVSPDRVRIIAYNTTTNEIYYDKLY